MNPSLTGAAAAIVLLLAGVAVLWRQRRRERDRAEGLQARITMLEAERAQVDRLAIAGRVAAGLAHEVGNPLCAITNYVHSLNERAAPELRGTLQSLHREVGRIERMMDGFIDYARPGHASEIGADVAVAMHEALSFLADQGVLRRITVEPRLDSKPMPVPATALVLEQVFANLFLNAADAMPAGGTLRISVRRWVAGELIDAPQRRASDAFGAGGPVRMHPPDERLIAWVAGGRAAEIVKVVVADSGHGVKAGDEERIFEPYVTSKSREQGSGLGLAVVKRLVRNMNGLVWVQRSREGGAAFHIVMPVQPASVAPRAD